MVPYFSFNILRLNEHHFFILFLSGTEKSKVKAWFSIVGMLKRMKTHIMTCQLEVMVEFEIFFIRENVPLVPLDFIERSISIK